MENVYDVIIIGGGPAGLSAGLYCSRARLKTLILEKNKLGGQIVLTHEIANYPGAIMGKDCEPSGIELINRMKEQAIRFGTEIAVAKEIINVELDGNIKVVTCKDGSNYYAKSIIIATGSVPRELGIPGEKALKGKGVSYCATCDAAFFEDLEVIVVGGGNSAVEEAMFISNFASKVTVVQNLDYLTADAIAIETAQKNKKISFMYNSVLQEIKGDGMVESVTIKNLVTNEVVRINANKEDETFGVFVFIGYIPQTKLFEGKLKLDSSGYIISDDSLETSQKGVFCAGDLRPKLLRQVITAASDGATAAFAVVKYLENLSHWWREKHDWINVRKLGKSSW